MPRFETYHVGNAVRIRRVGAAATGSAVIGVPTEATVVEPVAVAAPDEPTIDESMTKAELIAEAEKRGLDSSGTKADLVARIHG